MNDVQIKIQDAIGEFGENVITENRLVYILDDSGVLRDLKAEKRILRTIIEEGYTESVLSHSKESDLHLKICSYISEINKNHGYEVEKLKTVFSWITDGLGIPPVPYNTLMGGDKKETENNSLLPPPIPVENPPVISDNHPVESEVPPTPTKQQDTKQAEPRKPEPKKPKKKSKKGYSWVSSIIFLLVAFGLQYYLNLKKSEQTSSNSNGVGLVSDNERKKTDALAVANNANNNETDIDTTSFYEDTLYIDEGMTSDEIALYGNSLIPSWMVGKWKCKTQYGTLTMTINSDGSGDMDSDRGTFIFNGDVLEFRSPANDGVVTPMGVDETNQRLGAGHGYFYEKVTDENDANTPNQSNKKNNISNATTQNLTMVGTINNEYPITMKIEMSRTGSMNGYYFYNRNGPGNRLNVYGQLDGSRFRLQEYDNDNNNTGNFVGTYHNGEVTGTFSLPNGKTMSFDLEVVN